MEKYQITVQEIVDITNGKLVIGKEDTIVDNFSRDSREINAGDVYLGIKGEKMNGSIFFEDTFNKGAIGAILQDIEINDDVKEKYQDKFIIIVADTVKAMQQIATHKRDRYNIPVVAITGSVGKTSTRDMIASVMSEQFNNLKTEKNYNNHIGVPLTIFKLKDEESMTIEMGMNHLGEISVLTNIAKPTVAVITNVGTAHIGILGSRENILKAKLEILEGLDENGYVVINNDNDLLHEWYEHNKGKYRIITYGIENESEYMPENIELREDGSTYTLKGTSEKIEVPIGGSHFILNSLCAIAVGKTQGIPMDKIIHGIKNVQITKQRMDIERLTNGITVIKDYYNANFDSMKAAIEYLGNIKNKRRIAVLGDMLELGDYSKELHENVGKEVAKNSIDVLITVGNEAHYIAEQAKQNVEEVIECSNNTEAVQHLNEIKQDADYILLKASNGMKFGEIYDGIK